MLTIAVIPPYWQYTGSWNPFSCKTRTCLYHIAYIMAADDLAPCVARASAAMILTWLNRYNWFSHAKGWEICSVLLCFVLVGVIVSCLSVHMIYLNSLGNNNKIYPLPVILDLESICWCRLTRKGIPIMLLITSYDHLIQSVGIPILVTRHICSESALWTIYAILVGTKAKQNPP